jgi:hypothetical protein
MLPFIIAAAASILANQERQRQERQQLYLKELEQNAARMGGNTQLADVYNTGRQIDAQGADYGSALGLVGQFGGGADSSADTNPDNVFGPTSYAHDFGGVQYNNPVTLGGENDDELQKLLRLR